jgi:hypothetical protein
MFQEFINYLKYIGFINEETYPVFSSELDSNSEQENNNKNPKLKLITAMSNYIKLLSDEQTKKIMTDIFERYLENKIKINSKKLLNLIRIYRNKEIKFYMIYWYKLSQYLLHKEIQKYQQYNNNKSEEFLEMKTINNNSNSNIKGSSNIIFPNNISTIKGRNSNMNTISVNNISNKIKYITPKSLSKDFIERQEKFIQMKQKNLMKNIDSNEEEFQLLHTFKPNLINSMIPYNGNDKYRYENLYNNKMHEMRIKNLREVIDNERGYTFKTKINQYKNFNTTKKKE